MTDEMKQDAQSYDESQIQVLEGLDAVPSGRVCTSVLPARRDCIIWSMRS